MATNFGTKTAVNEFLQPNFGQKMPKTTKDKICALCNNHTCHDRTDYDYTNSVSVLRHCCT